MLRQVRHSRGSKLVRLYNVYIIYVCVFVCVIGKGKNIIITVGMSTWRGKSNDLRRTVNHPPPAAAVQAAATAAV